MGQIRFDEMQTRKKKELFLFLHPIISKNKYGKKDYDHTVFHLFQIARKFLLISG